MSITPSDSTTVSGFCQTCARMHRLDSNHARAEAELLIARLEESQSIDIFGSSQRRREHLSIAPLFGQQRGKMFGVLLCLDALNNPLCLYAFSGQFNGRWLAPGWVPPLFDVEMFQRVNNPIEKKIKELGRDLSSETDSIVRQMKTKERKDLSRSLMRTIHGLYRLHNYRGEERSLEQLFGPAPHLPTGLGDCCAPKLLSCAAAKGYTPVSLSEFYFGRANSSGTRQHKMFYPPCSEKCRPLLGFLLCGLD